MYIQGGFVLLLLKLFVCFFFSQFCIHLSAFNSNATESYHLALKSVLMKYSKILILQCCCCFVLCFFFRKNNNESFTLNSGLLQCSRVLGLSVLLVVIVVVLVLRRKDFVCHS